MLRVLVHVLIVTALCYSMSSLLPETSSLEASGAICCADDDGCPSTMYCAAEGSECDPSAAGYCRPRATR